MAKNCRIQGYMQDKSSKMKISIYTWKLAETRQFKQLQNTALQAPIDGANIWTATWLYNIVQLLGSSIIETQDLILASRNSKRSSLETQGSSYEFRGSSVNLLLSGTVSIILYIPDWKNIVV